LVKSVKICESVSQFFARARNTRVLKLPLQCIVVNPTQVTRLARPLSFWGWGISRGLKSAQNDGSCCQLIISREGVYELTRSALIATVANEESPDAVPVCVVSFLQRAGDSLH